LFLRVETLTQVVHLDRLQVRVEIVYSNEHTALIALFEHKGGFLQVLWPP
jgi:hypothetical protein